MKILKNRRVCDVAVYSNDLKQLITVNQKNHIHPNQKAQQNNQCFSLCASNFNCISYAYIIEILPEGPFPIQFSF